MRPKVASYYLIIDIDRERDNSHYRFWGTGLTNMQVYDFIGRLSHGIDLGNYPLGLWRSILPGHRGPRAIVPHQKATLYARGTHVGPYAAASHGQRGRLGNGQVGHGGGSLIGDRPPGLQLPSRDGERDEGVINFQMWRSGQTRVRQFSHNRRNTASASGPAARH